MSSAPVPWLRHWWALGGAPAAFVQRDERLTRVCERVSRAGEPVALLDGDAYATLVAQVDLNGLVRPRDDAQPSTSAGADDLRRVREGVAPRRSEAATAPDSSSSRGTETEARRPRPFAGQAAAHGRDAWRPVLQHVDEPPIRRVISAGNAATPLAPAQSPPASRVVPDIRQPKWMARAVATVQRLSSPELAARVDTLLREAQPTAGTAPRPTTIRRVPAWPGDAVAAAQTHGAARVVIGENLARIVERVEEQRAARDRVAPVDRGEGVDGPPRAIPRAGVEPARRLASRQALVPVGGESTRPVRSVPTSGLRGLVERASFMGVRRPAEDSAWPDDELDRFARLVDAAARQDGVSVEEAVS